MKYSGPSSRPALAVKLLALSAAILVAVFRIGSYQVDEQDFLWPTLLLMLATTVVGGNVVPRTMADRMAPENLVISRRRDLRIGVLGSLVGIFTILLDWIWGWAVPGLVACAILVAVAVILLVKHSLSRSAHIAIDR